MMMGDLSLNLVETSGIIAPSGVCQTTPVGSLMERVDSRLLAVLPMSPVAHIHQVDGNAPYHYNVIQSRSVPGETHFVAKS